MPLIKCDGFLIGPVGEQSDPPEPLGPRIADGMSQQTRSQPIAPVFGQHDHVFQPACRPAFRGADREQQAHHPRNLATDSGYEDSSAIGSFDNQAQRAHLLLAVGMEVGFLREEDRQEASQLRNVGRGRLFDVFHGCRKVVNELERMICLKRRTAAQCGRHKTVF